MDIGINLTLNDPSSIVDPQVIAFNQTINPLMSKAFGKVYDLFTVRDTPIATDEYQIYNRSYTTPDVLTGASAGGTLWDNVATTVALPMNSTTIDRITVGDVLLVDSEVVTVKSVDRSAFTIDVYERGAGETAGAAHGTSGKSAKIIGNAHREGRVDGEAMAEATAPLTNYMQLVQELVDLSVDNIEQQRKYGRTEDTLRQEAMTRVMRDLARLAIYNPARQNTATIPGMTRGLIEHLRLGTNLVTAVGGAFTQTALQNAVDGVNALGGSVNAIIMSIKQKRVFNTFTGADSTTFDIKDRVGGKVIDGYIADGMGEVLPVIVDMDWPDDKVALVNTNMLSKSWKQADALRFVLEPNTNSREKKENLQGKIGLAVEGVGVTHALLTGLS